MSDPTTRFSSRVEDYVKYRPGYPQEVVDTFCAECGLGPGSIVADLGSGTGILTKLLLESGLVVFAVEPNADMRAAAERMLASAPGFRSVAGRSEATTLEDHCVDAISIAQAFHWFDRPKSRAEFLRILRPGGFVMMVWNERDTVSTPFLVAYERMLHRYALDYAEVDHRQAEAGLAEFFGPGGCATKTFPYRQSFGFDGIKGRLLSSSYVPQVGHPNFEPMLAELDRLWRTHQVEGRLAFEYATKMFYGRLT